MNLNKLFNNPTSLALNNIKNIQYSIPNNNLNIIYRKLFYSTSNNNNKGLLGLVLNQDGKGGCLVDIRVNEPIIIRSDYFKRFTKRVAATSLFLGNDINTQAENEISKKTSKKKKSKAGKCQTIDVKGLLNCPLLPHPDANPVDDSEFQFQLVKDALKNCSWKLNDELKIYRSVISQHSSRVVTGGFIMPIPEKGSVETPIDIINALTNFSDEDKILQEQGFGEIASMITLSLKGKRSKAVSVLRKMSRFANLLAKHVTVFNPLYISESDYKKKTHKNKVPKEDKDKILSNQIFMFDNEHTVAEALVNVGDIDDVEVTISSFIRWTLKD
ncbi:hypothetical protein LY90DRAFT_666520 [Neocallimastix californiae]|jgi:translation elongation factor EF-Ts|uniref:Uncharacterized protein n=1 Tax=Neocallimastix californiae TaxID=1754190 RepID=A0A1Y2ERG3_9FUNG|nr:hypothetical protein LY90DRAFT_666520 [Neocallimastix californiae]|eukprot:ORY73766.1 hypothetical protein LY90DRAFT_666520 [Neocallimastix californiae]